MSTENGYPSALKYALYTLFCLSGLCALVYEILWFKRLSLVFGTSILASSIVAGTFMAGLALGSFLFGRYADRSKNLLLVYALLELAIAIFALSFDPALHAVENIYVVIYQAWASQPAVAAFFRLIFAALLLLPPTTCMGGTLPVICRFFTLRQLSGQVGRLYALNTLGATIGTFSAGFYLIPNLGLTNTLFLAFSINCFIAAVSFGLSRNPPRPLIPPRFNKNLLPPFQATHSRFVLISASMIGFLALAYEILWTRLFLLFIGNTTYSFATILSVYLIGLALGGGIYARISRHSINLKKLYCLLIAVSGASVVLTSSFYDQLPTTFLAAHALADGRWWLLSLFSIAIVFLVICIPTVLSGMLLPAAVALLSPSKDHSAEGVGTVVLFNTVGAIIGSLCAGFALIPGFGLQGSFLSLGLLNTLLAFAGLYIFRNAIPNITLPSLLLLGAILLAFIPNQWDQRLMNAGVYYYASTLNRDGLDRTLKNVNLLSVIEGTEATVAVKERISDGLRALAVNGKIDAGTGEDMATQILLAQIPLLVHPTAREALVIGLGSGITLGAAKEHPLNRIDCVEISPGVVQASAFFKKENRSALSDPKVKLFIRDGRNMLLTDDRTYDVIISEPSNPWQTGNANLFTADFYQLAARRLNDKGIFCQWVPLYDMTTENLRILSNTFLQTFSNVMVFDVGNGDIILLGAESIMSFDYRAIHDRMLLPGVKDSLATIDVLSAGDFLARHYLYSDNSLRHFAQGATVNSDNFPVLEYSRGTQKSSEKNLMAANIDQLTRAKKTEQLPLVNVGTTNIEIAAALFDLAKSYEKEEKMELAEYFLELARKYAGR